MPTFNTLPQHIIFFAGLLAFLSVLFVLFYFLPALLLWRDLNRVIKRLAASQNFTDSAAAFQAAGALGKRWNEYADSLYPHDDDASSAPLNFRSTLPAAAVFRPEAIIDTALHTDFFKHLPGLFTGVGIIGTFYGLLIGLQTFEISENPLIVRNSLRLLLHGVSEAFLISAIAISLAMTITFFEKLLVAKLNARLEALNQQLDQLFSRSSSEAYLARLVRAAETTSEGYGSTIDGGSSTALAQSIALQTAALNDGISNLGDRIVGCMEKAFSGHLNEMARLAREQSADRDASIVKMMQEGLADFSRQLDVLLGHQATGLNQLQQQTIDALQSAVSMLQTMSGRIEAAGTQSLNDLAARLAETTAGADARQRVLNEKMGEFVEEMRKMASATHDGSKELLSKTIADLSAVLEASLSRLTDQTRTATDASEKRIHDMMEGNQTRLTDLGNQVAGLIDSMSSVSKEIRDASRMIRDTAGDATVRLASSADTLYLAAKDFAQAGQSVTSTLEKSTALSNRLTQAAGMVSSASQGLSESLADYRMTRNAMAEMAQHLRELLDQARREAAVNSDVIARIEAATARLIEAQHEVEKYLAGVTEVIGAAHQSFSDGMVKAVGEANRDFHQALSDSVSLLREGIQELEETINIVQTG